MKEVKRKNLIYYLQEGKSTKTDFLMDQNISHRLNLLQIPLKNKHDS